MKALFIDAPGHIEIREAPDPKPLPGQALIEVSRCGLCGSDISAYRGGNATIEYPILIGHEVVGVIREIEDGHELKKGDRVVVEPFTFCGECLMCGMGRYNNCTRLKTRGCQIPGTMSTLITHDVRQLFKIPDSLSDTDAAMVEPLTIALNALRRGSVKSGDMVLITGAGTIGLLAALGCMAYGAVPMLVEPVERRLDIAGKLGIRHVLNSSGDADVVEFLRERTNGYLANVVIECSGAGSVLEKLTDYAGFGGRIVFVGWPKAPVSFNAFWFLRKELDLFGSRNSCNCFPEAIESIATGKIDASRLITEIIRLDDAPRFVPIIAQHPEKYLKVIVDLT